MPVSELSAPLLNYSGLEFVLDGTERFWSSFLSRARMAKKSAYQNFLSLLLSAAKEKSLLKKSHSKKIAFVTVEINLGPRSLCSVESFCHRLAKRCTGSPDLFERSAKSCWY